MKRENAIRAAKQLLSEIQLSPRNYPGKGREVINPVGKITISLPQSMVERLTDLGGARSHHIEKALSLYFELYSEK